LIEARLALFDDVIAAMPITPFVIEWMRQMLFSSNGVGESRQFGPRMDTRAAFHTRELLQDRRSNDFRDIGRR
jgi:hypothetical protein